MKKTIIKITESDLHNMIMEAVNEIATSELFNGEYTDNLQDYDKNRLQGLKIQKALGDRAQDVHPQATPFGHIYTGEYDTPENRIGVSTRDYPNGLDLDTIENLRKYDQEELGL